MRNTEVILITGALGHIGSRLVRDLPEGFAKKLVMLDNLATQRYASLFDLPGKFQYEFFEEDILNSDLDQRTKNVRAVIHLAALTDAETSHSRAAEVEKVNFLGLVKVADACVKNQVPLFFPSTTSVYGSQAERVDEACKELRPQSPYAASKLEAENYLIRLKDKGLRFTIFRLGTIFGYSLGMRFHTAVNKFIWQAVNGQPLTVWKTAWKQKRPYLDLGDCVRAVALVLEKNAFDGEIYNVLTANYTVEEIAEKIRSVAPKLQISYVDSPIMNQLSYEVDDRKFRALGFTPSGSLAAGISETISHLQRIKI